MVGPSGCGKSTLLRCINALEPIQGGTIKLQGMDIRKGSKNITTLRQKIGMVFQSYELFPHLTVIDNITLAPVKVQKRDKAEAQKEAMELLARVGLADKAKSYPRQLSGGQKQRVAIVRALCMHPEILLFDEVTAALDPEMVREVLDVMLDLAKKDDRLVAITAAMEDGTGLAAFHRYYPDRFFDVGIAEGHGVTFAAGLAAAGLHPVFAVYSSFLQRGFDQMIHDVCLQKLPVVFAVDRAGLVGSDGETHQGIFDLSYLSMIPNMTVLSPKNKWELADMVRFAVRLGAPAAVRYPRGSAFDGFREYRAPIEYGKSEPVYEEEDIAIISVGHMFEQAVQVRKRLKGIGYNCTLINARFVKPVDEEMLRKLTVEHRLIVTLEENIRRGGFGEFVTAYLAGLETDAEVLNLALPDDYIEHGSVDLLRSEVMLDIESCVARIITAYIAEESRRD